MKPGDIDKLPQWARREALRQMESKGATPYVAKYRNLRAQSVVTGRTHHSRGEASFADVLAVLEHEMVIGALVCQPRVKLMGCVAMIPDFRFTVVDAANLPHGLETLRDGETVHLEYKGFATSTWALQRRLWEQVGPTVYVVVRKKSGDKLYPYTYEIIRPQPSDELIELVKQHMKEKP